jgi:arsenite-transporting ATPase
MDLSILFPKEKGIILVCGKGGVGKTTFSSLFSVYSRKNLKTLAVSIDPAHHLGDVLGYSLSHQIKEISNNLYAAEPDMERLIKEYIQGSIEILKYTYKDLVAMNLDKYLDALEESPGIEEDTLLDYIWKLKKMDFEITVVDTPPTSITTRVLKLPWLQSMWVERLIDLRGKIMGYKETIESIKAGKKLKLDDPILNELIKMSQEIEDGKKFLNNKEKVKIVGVTVAEKLPYLELKRFRNSIMERNISLAAIVINRYVDDAKNREFLNEINSEFIGIPKIIIPFSSEDLIGIYKLENFIEKIRVIE